MGYILSEMFQKDLWKDVLNKRALGGRIEVAFPAGLYGVCLSVPFEVHTIFLPILLPKFAVTLYVLGAIKMLIFN